MPPIKKTVRIFISSTFRDMHAERDHLVTVVFPELRERLERLNLEFYDVDLRWGVPEKGPDGEIANSWAYCKQWIERVEPFFISLLGQRYGWIPPASEIRDEKDRAKYKGMSITEMEIRHAVFSGDLHRRSFFYFREAVVPGDTSPNIYREFVDPDEQERLRHFKEEIAASGQPVRRYGCSWTGTGFANLDAFGRMVLEDLWSGVLRDERYVSKEAWKKVLGRAPESDLFYTDESQPLPDGLWQKVVAAAKPAPSNPLEVEIEQMSAFAAGRLRWFRGRVAELKQLSSFVNSDDVSIDSSHLCVVRAVAGQGKSALLAKLAEQLANTSHLVITHFVGATERGTSTHGMLERLDRELERNGIMAVKEEDQGYDLESLRKRFVQRLENYDGEHRLVLLIDAINQLTDGQDLSWLPRRLGASVRMILSSTTEPVAVMKSTEAYMLAAMHNLVPQPQWVEVGPLDKSDVRAIVVDYLHEYCKELDEAQIETICNMDQAHNPLYLLVMLNELRTLGGNDMNRIVPQMITEMKVKYPDTAYLFDWVLERLEVFGTDVVKLWCIYLISGREGMTSRELSALLARKLGDEAARTALLIERGLRRYLQKRGPQLDFFHDQLRKAVQRRYVRDGVISPHVDIAEYFESRWKEPYIRALNELPYHFYNCHRFEKLQEFLTNLEYIHQCCKYCDVYALIEDYEKIPEAARVQTEPFRRFLRAHSQSLMEYREFFSTYLYEASREDRNKMKAASYAWQWPYLRTEHLSTTEISNQAEPDDPLRKDLSFQFGQIVPAVSLAPLAGLAFYVSQVGEIRLVSLENARELREFISIRRERPLELTSSADGRYLAVAYETGETDIIHLSYDSNWNLTNFENVTTIYYLLPEFEKPFIKFIDSKLYYQRSSSELVSYDPASRQESIILDRVVNGGEFSCMVQLDGHIVCMFRHKSDTLVMVVSIDGLRLQSSTLLRGVDVSTACVRDSANFYLALTNFEIVGLSLNRENNIFYRQAVKEVPEVLFCLQNSLLWVSNGNMYAQFTDRLERPSENVFADKSLVDAMSVDLCNDNELCIVSRAGISCFRINNVYEQSLTHILRIFEIGEDNYVALCREKELLYLIDVGKQIGFPLWENADRAFVTDIDGLNNLIVIGKSGTGIWCNSAELSVKPLEGLPTKLQCITGVPLGGFWMVDERARLYYLCSDHQISHHWDFSGRNLSGKWICSDGKQLVLCCIQLLVDYPTCELLFMDIDSNGVGIHLRGSRSFYMHQYEINSMAWDSKREELYLIGRMDRDCAIKRGTPKQFIEEGEETHRMQDLDLVINRAAVDAHDNALWLISSKGNLYRVWTDPFKVEAVLSPTNPITEMVARPSGSQTTAFVSNQARIFRCSFVGGDAA